MPSRLYRPFIITYTAHVLIFALIHAGQRFYILGTLQDQQFFILGLCTPSRC
nr:MAG TPA: hypothetical protein [Caudoviricetes sp.]